MPSDTSFLNRFADRTQVERYLDRFKRGRRRRTHAREVAALHELISTTEAAVVLDLPCGPGRFVPVWVRHATRVILADASSAVVQFVGENLPPNGSCVETRAEDIDLPDQSVDLIFSHRFLPHVRDRALRTRILSEFYRVTRRYLVVSHYSRSWSTRIRWWFRSTFTREDRHDVLSSERQLLYEVQNVGFRLIRRERLRRYPSGSYFLFERPPLSTM